MDLLDFTAPKLKAPIGHSVAAGTGGANRLGLGPLRR